MSYKGGVPIEDVFEAITGIRPEPFEIKCPKFLKAREAEGKARRENTITDEKQWLEQLARFKEPAPQPAIDQVPESANV